MDNGGAFSQRLFDTAGGLSGLSVLDVGCGTGDVAVRIADAVGPSGHVMAIDPSEGALETARSRLGGRENIDFVQTDIEGAAALGRTFDLVTCRRVVMYLPDRLAALKTLYGCLRPGGRALIHEHDATVRFGDGDFPLRRQAQGWIWDTVQAEGANVRTGSQLYRLLSEAGFNVEIVLSEAVIQTPEQPGLTAKIVEIMQPRIVAAGVASAQELGVETLADRLAAEMEAAGGAFVGEMMFGAVARREG